MEEKVAVIDESGDLGLTNKSSRNFINTTVIVSDINQLERAAKKVYSRKVLDKHKKNQLHANKDNYKIHKAILKELENIDYETVFINNKDYFKNLEELFIILKSKKVTLAYLAVRDSRKSILKRITDLANTYGITIKFSSPTKHKALQIADFVSWVVFRKLEYGDDLYFLKIKFSKK